MEMAGLEEVRDSAMLAADWWEEEADLSGTFVGTFFKIWTHRLRETMHFLQLSLNLALTGSW
jgi:hypothetical protein